MNPLTMALVAGGGSAIGALPSVIPSKFERDQKKRLRDMQRKQEMGTLGLTDRERASIEGVTVRHCDSPGTGFANHSATPVNSCRSSVAHFADRHS